MTGTIVKLPTPIARKLDKLSGDEKIELLNSPETISGISGFCHVRYGREKPHDNICEIGERTKMSLEEVVATIREDMPDETIIWDSSEVNLTEGLKMLNAGFGNPYINNVSPLGKQFTSQRLCMFLAGQKPKTTVSELKSIIKSYKLGQACSLKVRMPPKTVAALKKILERGDKEGRELAGGLDLKWSEPDGEYLVRIHEESIQNGEGEEVDIIEGRQNFHIHPAYAYKNHNVKVGWPSSQDYIGYLVSHKKYSTLFHVVCSLEGIYVISLSNYWFKNFGKTDDAFMKYVEKEFAVDKGSDLTVPEYIRKVNGISYKDKRIFDVKFFDWKNAATSFTVVYPMVNRNCFKDEETFRFVQNFY